MSPTPPAASTEARTRAWQLALLWLGCFGAAALYAWWNRPNAPDDAMIVLRYARNLVQGHGWVYNEGVHVNGSTSTLNTLLLATLGWVTGERWFLAQVLAFGIGIGNALFACVRLSLPSGRAPAILAGILVLATPLLSVCVGMETPLLLGFTALAALHFERGAYRRCGLWLGLLCLTRPDGVLLVLLILVAFGLRHRREWREQLAPLLHAIALFVLVQLPWYAFAYLQFGALVPQTLGAKLAQVDAGVLTQGSASGVYLNGLDQLMRLLQATRRPIDFAPEILELGGKAAEEWPNPALYTLHAYYTLLVPLGTYLLALASLTVAALTRSPLLLPILWGILHGVVYALFGLGHYAWYYVPLCFAMTLGVAALAGVLWGRDGTPRRRRLFRGLALTLALGFSFVHFAGLRRSDERYAFYAHYVETAKWLNEHAPAGATVACCEIGVLGYEMPGLRILDMWGLVNREGAVSVAKGDFTWWTREEAEFVIMHDPPWGRIEAPALELEDFRGDYELAGRIVTKRYPDLYVWRRRF